MSFAAKLSIGLCLVATGGAIGYYVVSQQMDKREPNNETVKQNYDKRHNDEIDYVAEEIELTINDEEGGNESYTTEPFVMINLK